MRIGGLFCELGTVLTVVILEPIVAIGYLAYLRINAILLDMPPVKGDVNPESTKVKPLQAANFTFATAHQEQQAYNAKHQPEYAHS
jgi:hypothetical protein